MIRQGPAALVFVHVLFSCSLEMPKFRGLACDENRICAVGFTCDVETNTCVPEDELLRADVTHSGSDLLDAGSTAGGDGGIEEGDFCLTCECKSGATKSCGVNKGICRKGVRRCIDGRWSGCDGAVGPQNEICDNLDNDCDGQTDGDIGGEVCELQAGICSGSRQLCVAGEWIACSAGVGYPSSYKVPEVTCDNLDNDCDGQTDEVITGPPCTLQQGVCSGATMVCQGGRWNSCIVGMGYPQGYEPVEATCDDQDNDCNGRVDDGLDPDICEYTCIHHAPDTTPGDGKAFGAELFDHSSNSQTGKCCGDDANEFLKTQGDARACCADVNSCPRGDGACSANLQPNAADVRFICQNGNWVFCDEQKDHDDVVIGSYECDCPDDFCHWQPD